MCATAAAKPLPMSRGESLPIEHAVEKQGPEGIVRREERERSDVAAPRKATGGGVRLQFLVRAVGELRYHVELDPPRGRLVVRNEETMGCTAPGAKWSETEPSQGSAQSRHVAACDKQIDVAVGRSEIRLAA